MRKLLYLIIIVVLIASVLCSCAQSKQEPIAVFSCYDCGDEFPDEYGVPLYSGNKVCNECAQGIIVSFQLSLKYALEDLEESGVYLTDYDFMMVSIAMCNHCGEWAPSVLRDTMDEPICFNCMNDAIQNKNVAKALDRYFEYG